MTLNPSSRFLVNTKICLISPIGNFDSSLIDRIATQISDVFGFNTEIASLVNSIDFAYDPHRNQYHSTPVLEKLAGLAATTYDKVIALTKEDLFIPILTHVYGEAQLGGTSCIVSIARLGEELNLEEERDRFHQRIVKEALHELGHTFNLLHCKDPDCIMHYCRSIEDVDRKADKICRYCTVLLDDELKKNTPVPSNLK